MAGLTFRAGGIGPAWTSRGKNQREAVRCAARRGASHQNDGPPVVVLVVVVAADLDALGRVREDQSVLSVVGVIWL